MFEYRVRIKIGKVIDTKKFTSSKNYKIGDALDLGGERYRVTNKTVIGVGNSIWSLDVEKVDIPSIQA